ncbi:hypothetical protein EfmJHP10_33230 (plasmid) [Enterococcus faecium]|nr:hypothetical protein EfmJHP9_32400 [Enterococcus faecium]BDP51887.1 hypothetical protein EfmJHP10_33230 [Enterococcus faecium]
MKTNPKKNIAIMTVQWYYYYTINFAKGVGLNRKQKEIEPRQIQLVYRKGSKFDFG